MSPTRYRHGLLLAVLWVSAPRAEFVPFAPPEPINAEGVAIASALAADLDGDGDEDIVYARRSSGDISWSRNNRSTFRARETIVARTDVQHVVAADFDGDGRVDLVSATAAGSLAWHRGLAPNAGGLAQFDTRAAFATGLPDVTRFATGDLNADGRADLVVGRNSGTPLHAFVFTGSAVGFGSDITVAVPTGTVRIGGVGIADFDGNGHADIIATGSAAPNTAQPVLRLFVVPRDSASTFGAPIVVESLIVGGTPTRAEYGPLVVGDFDDANGPDVVFVRNISFSANEVVLRSNPGAGFGALEPTGRTVLHSQTNNAFITSVQAADVDRDGDLDIAYHDLTGQPVNLLDNLRTQFFRRATGASGQVSDTVATLVFDADLDGDPDLHAVTAAGTVLYLENRRIHGSTLQFGHRTATVLTAMPAGALAGPFDVVTRRLGRSTLRETVFTEFTGGRVQSFTASSTSAFDLTLLPAPLPILESVGAARELATFDGGHDGDDDLILATAESASVPVGNQNRLVVSVNVVGGTPSNAVLNCTQADDLQSVAIAEFAGLGARVVYAAEDNNRIALIATCPTETLISTPGNGAPNAPGTVKLGDLDQDGDLDILVAARLPEAPPLSGDLLGWYPNLGAATFGTLRRIATVSGARDATLLDLDRDGRLDVLAGSGGSLASDPLAGRILLFRGLGNGDFSGAIQVADELEMPGRIEGADFDHDGDIDLVVPSESPRAIGAAREQCGLAFVESLGFLTFRQPVCVDTGTTARRYSRAAVEDINNDGNIDIVATSFPDNVVVAFATRPPQEYRGGHFFLGGDAVMEDGAEFCAFELRMQSDGRNGDSRIALDSYGLIATASDVDGVLDAIVLRRDDGDGVADPALDVEIGRVETLVSGRLEIDVASADSSVEVGETARFWACLKAVATVPETAQEYSLQQPTHDSEDASTGALLFAVFTRNLSAGSRARVRSAAVFSDGLEAD